MSCNIRLLRLHNICIGFIPAAPLFIIHFTNVAGSITGGAAIFALSMVIAAVFDLPAGAISDRVGRKCANIAGSVLITLCLIAYAAAPNVEWLVVAAVLDGLGMALWSGNTPSLLHDTLKVQGRLDDFAVEFGKLQGCYHWSVGVSAIVGGALALHSLTYAFWACVPLHVAAVAVGFFIHEPIRHKGEATLSGHFQVTASAYRNDKGLARLSAGAMLTSGAGMAGFALRSVWMATLWPTWAIAGARSGAALLAAAGTWWGGSITKRFGARRSLVATIATSTVANSAAIAFPTVVSPVVLTSASLVYGMAGTAEQTLLHQRYTDAQRATMSSLVSVGSRMLAGLFTVGLGVVADRLGPAAALLLAEAVMLVALPLYLPVGALRDLRARRNVSNAKRALSR